MPLVTDAREITIDASTGSVFRLYTEGDRLVLPPLNPTGDQVIIIAHHAVGDDRTVTLDSVFGFGSDIAGPTKTLEGKTDYFTCIYDATQIPNVWHVVDYKKGY